MTHRALHLVVRQSGLESSVHLDFNLSLSLLLRRSIARENALGLRQTLADSLRGLEYVLTRISCA